MLADFQIYTTIVFSVKFATKFMSYISSHFKGVTPLPCRTQKTEISKIMLHVTQ